MNDKWLTNEGTFRKLKYTCRSVITAEEVRVLPRYLKYLRTTYGDPYPYNKDGVYQFEFVSQLLSDTLLVTLVVRFKTNYQRTLFLLVV